MLRIPILRWGQPYSSLDEDDVVHFITGETLAKVSQANTGLLARDIRHAQRASECLREIPANDLVEMMKKAGEYYLNDTLPLGDGEQSPDDFARQQSATTGLPEHMCKANMHKNHFVLSHMGQMLDALTRGLDLDILTRGYGVEDRGVFGRDGRFAGGRRPHLRRLRRSVPPPRAAPAEQDEHGAERDCEVGHGFSDARWFVS